MTVFHSTILGIEMIQSGEPVIDIVANRPHLRLWENTMANREDIQNFFLENVINLRIRPTDPASNKVICEGGKYISSNGKRILEIPEDTLSPEFFPVSGPGKFRFDILAANDLEQLVVIPGYETSVNDPLTYAPDISPDAMTLAVMRITEAGAVIITIPTEAEPGLDDDITDAREFLNKGGGTGGGEVVEGSSYTTLKHEIKNDWNPAAIPEEKTWTLPFIPDMSKGIMHVVRDKGSCEHDVEYTLVGNTITFMAAPQQFTEVFYIESSSFAALAPFCDYKTDWDLSETTWATIHDFTDDKCILVIKDHGICEIGVDYSVLNNVIEFTAPPQLFTRVIAFTPVSIGESVTTYLELTDTDDTTYAGKAEHIPVVKGTVDGLTLLPRKVIETAASVATSLRVGQGTDNKVNMYHDGTHGHINTESGDLYLDSNSGAIRSGGQIYNAVYNDIAETFPLAIGHLAVLGCCYVIDMDGLHMSSVRNEVGVIGVYSDQHAFCMGKIGAGRIPIALSGRVPALVDAEYSPGTLLIAGESGKLTEAITVDEKINACAKYLTGEKHGERLVWVKVI